MTSAPQQQQSHPIVIVDLVAELKDEHRVSLSSFKLAVKTLTSTVSTTSYTTTATRAIPITNTSAVTSSGNIYRFLLLDISTYVYDHGEVELNRVIGSFAKRHDCVPGTIDGLVLEVLTQLAVSNEKVDVPYHINICEAAVELLHNELISQEEVDWWFDMCSTADQLRAAVAGNNQVNIEICLDKLAPHLNKLRDTLKLSHVSFGLEYCSYLGLASKPICWLLDGQAEGVEFAPLLY